MSGFNDDVAPFVASNRSFRRSDNDTEPDKFSAVYPVFYVTLTVGIPSNILSAIVWLRHGIASKSSSAVYLTAVALNDLAYMLTTFLYIDVISQEQLRWLHGCASYLAMCTATLEPLLVLGFSVERLIAILRPLRVRYKYAYLYYMYHGSRELGARLHIDRIFVVNHVQENVFSAKKMEIRIHSSLSV